MSLRREDLADEPSRGIRSTSWVSGGPIRFAIGGVGSDQFLGLTLEPLSWGFWLAATSGHRNVKLLDLGCVGAQAPAREEARRRWRNGGDCAPIWFRVSRVEEVVAPYGVSNGRQRVSLR